MRALVIMTRRNRRTILFFRLRHSSLPPAGNSRSARREPWSGVSTSGHFGRKNDLFDETKTATCHRIGESCYREKYVAVAERTKGAMLFFGHSRPCYSDPWSGSSKTSRHSRQRTWPVRFPSLPTTSSMRRLWMQQAAGGLAGDETTSVV